MTDELKLCPFDCDNHGGRPVIRAETGAFHVFCNACNCSGPAEQTEELAIAAWNARAPSVPEGYALVPAEPDLTMCNRGFNQIDPMMENDRGIPLARRVYRAMLAAAPKVPT